MRLMSAAKVIGGALVFLLPVAAAPGCVLRLNDKNEPLPNGGVTGPAANCAAITPEAKGVAGGDAVTKYVGRISLKDPKAPQLDWSGGIMNARFEGTEVTWGAVSPDPLVKKEIIWEVVIDGGPPEEVILPDYRQNENAPITKKTHTLAPGVHEISVIRSSEAISGKVTLVPFTFGAGTKQLPPYQRARRIEYIGDSITCGYGIEGPNATCPYDVEIRPGVRIPVTQNIVLSYASLVAKELDADPVITCISGKGVYLNYREANGKVIPLDPAARPDPDAETPVPKYWERLFAAPDDGPPAAEPWDFAKEPEPSVVVIALGQNDFARDVNQNSITDYQEAAIPGIARFDPGTFGVEYKKFVQAVRAKRPKAHIFLALSPMMTDKFPIDDGRTIFRNTLNALVQDLNGAGDTKVYFLELVEMGVRYGLGCDYHPNTKVHEIMAGQVAGAIRSKTCW
ncbi:MAG: hypothetical protein JST00_03345 [Deltaproteobacteria bacterium]|nr:hypothetical protein [Deltaproteobacteria bacterium]